MSNLAPSRRHPDLPPAVADLLRNRPVGALTTHKRDGRAQQSVIAFAADHDGDRTRIRISVTGGRAKTRNAERDPRVNLFLASPDLGRWAVLEGQAQLSEPTRTPGDDPGRELAEVYRAIAGAEHPDWGEFARAMIDEGRRVLTVTVERTYGGGAG